MKVKVFGNVDNLDKKIKAFEPSKLPTLVAGVLGGATRNEGNGEQSVAKYAFWNEFGTERTPARPFLRNTVSAHEKEWASVIADGIRAGATPKEALEMLRQIVRADIVRTIEAGNFKPLAESTIKAKERRGSATPNSPLQDTQSLARSISTEIRDGG